MKQALIILVMLSSVTAYAQLTANAGADKVSCVDMEGLTNTTILGEDPAATGGTPPYTYTWEGSYTISIGNFTNTVFASDMISDTTAANPVVINPIGTDTWIDFVLTVEDANSAIAKDTMRLRYSSFGATLATYFFELEAGDSIYLNYGVNLLGGIPPYEYLWSPNHGLTDSTSLAFWAKPIHDVVYYPTVTDSAGCVAEGANYYYINVTPVAVDENLAPDLRINIQPIPATDKIEVITFGEVSFPLTYQVLDSRGTSILKGELNEETAMIEITSLEPGVYFLYTVDGKGACSSTKFVKNN